MSSHRLCLFILLLVLFSCTRERMTVTGAEHLYGKNKVQVTNYVWKEIQGDGYRVIYPEQLRRRALDVAHV